jgi:hypothetical protein
VPEILLRRVVRRHETPASQAIEFDRSHDPALVAAAHVLEQAGRQASRVAA